MTSERRDDVQATPDNPLSGRTGLDSLEFLSGVRAQRLEKKPLREPDTCPDLRGGRTGGCEKHIPYPPRGSRRYLGTGTGSRSPADPAPQIPWQERLARRPTTS